VRTALKISVLINLGLLAGAVILLVKVGSPFRTAQSLMARPTPPPMTVTVAAGSPATAPSAEPKPFCWSQLEAADYHRYVKNLRSIGCPERTLRAIVTADVNASYRVRADALEKKLADLAGSSWSDQLAASSTAAALKTELQQIPDEEAATIQNLLGLGPTPADALASAGTLMIRHSDQPHIDPPTMPLVFQNVNFTALNLDGDQIQVISNLRQGFTDEIGGLNQNPNDPAYLKRWQKAQTKADSLLEGILGLDLYTKYQMLAENQGNPAE